jgi:hypothetical protein
VRIAPGLGREADPVEQLDRAPSARRTVNIAQAKRDVCQRIEVREQREILEHHADPAALGAPKAG